MAGKPRVTNAADPQQVESAAKKEALDLQQRIDDIRVVLSTRAGRRFLWRKLVESGLFRSDFYGDPSYSYFVSGVRNAGCQLLAEIEAADPTAYPRMAQEAKAERDQRT